MPLTRELWKRLGSLQKPFTETWLSEASGRSGDVFIHPGKMQGTQPVLSECALNSDKHSLGA